MASILEEKLREAVCFGDQEKVAALLSQKVNVNSQNNVNGWTALHWACKRGHQEIARTLLENGADINLVNFQGEKPVDVCLYPSLCDLSAPTESLSSRIRGDSVNRSDEFVPSYIRNPPLNPIGDFETVRTTRAGISSMPTFSVPASLNDDLVLKVKLYGSPDPDFIEIEIPKWKLTYNNLLKICCEELHVSETQVERIRKLPNTRLRTDNDVKRLKDYQSLEIVLKNSTNEKSANCYESISTKHQTILY